MSSSTDSRLARLPGLETAKRVVRGLAIAEGGVHALLLYGAPGAGKLELANALAEAWLCQRPTDEGACGECPACASFGRGTNPDVLRIAPSGPSAIIKNEAITNDNPKDDDPTPLRGFFRTAPIASRHKIAIIAEAHRMNNASANALLKTLEEPEPFAKLILTTSSVGALPPTVVSRCLAAACALPLNEELRARYPEATEDDFRLAEGSPGNVQKILNRPKPYRRVADFARDLVNRPSGAGLVCSDEFRDIGEKIGAATDQGVRSGNAEALALLAALLARDPAANPRWVQWTAEAHRRILGNGSPTIVFDSLFCRMLSEQH